MIEWWPPAGGPRGRRASSRPCAGPAGRRAMCPEERTRPAHSTRGWRVGFGRVFYGPLGGQTSLAVPVRGPSGLLCGKRQPRRVNSEPGTQPPVIRGRKARRRTG